MVARDRGGFRLPAALRARAVVDPGSRSHASNSDLHLARMRCVALDAVSHF